MGRRIGRAQGGPVTAVSFVKASTEPVRFDKKLGRCVGWACFSKKNGEDYVDLHGDHFPDAELFEAVDALNKQPIDKREINIEHAGPGRGVIVSAFALTEDIAKGLTPPVDTGGTYGVLVSFEPDADLLKSIEGGGSFCLSIEGSAASVETIAKSAADIAATAHKRTMRKVTLTKLAVVKAGAHEGAAVSVIKAAPDAVTLWDAAVTKRAPALTDPAFGHQHLIFDVEVEDGTTSYEVAAGSEYGHCHPFVRMPDGSISIGEAAGHTHTLTNPENAAMADDLAKSLTAAQADLAKSRGLVAVAVNLPADQAAFAKRLSGDALESYLAKSDAERAALAKPVHIAKSGEVYFASDDPRLVSMAKTADAQAEIIAKQAEAAQLAVIAKTAESMPAVKGSALIAKAIYLLPEAERAEALADLATVNATIAKVCQPVGYGGHNANAADESSPAAKLDALAKAEQVKDPSLTFAKAFDVVLATPAGAALYAADQAAKPRASA